jgi:hypothetical protein
MTIDLNPFIGQDVIITLRNGDTHRIIIDEYNYDSTYKYRVSIMNGLELTYTREGSYDDTEEHELDIVKIELNTQKTKTMPFSSKAFQNLSAALTPEVIDYIEQDSRYVDFMQEIIPDALNAKMGQIDDELKFELSLAIMDRIVLITPQ